MELTGAKKQTAETYSKAVADDVKQIYGFVIPWDLILSIVMALFEKLCAKTPEELAEAVTECKHRKKRDKRMKQLRAAIRKADAGKTLSSSQVDDVADAMVLRATEADVKAVMAAPA